jgi:hypothetical protein
MNYGTAEFWKTMGLVHDLLSETTGLVRAMEQIAQDAEAEWRRSRPGRARPRRPARPPRRLWWRSDERPSSVLEATRPSPIGCPARSSRLV